MRAMLPILALTMALSAPAADAASIRKCVDAQGKVQFTDRPCDERPGTEPLKKRVAPLSEDEARVEGGTLTVYGAAAAAGAPRGARASRPAAGGGRKPVGGAAGAPNSAARMVDQRSNGQIPAK